MARLVHTTAPHIAAQSEENFRRIYALSNRKLQLADQIVDLQCRYDAVCDELQQLTGEPGQE